MEPRERESNKVPAPLPWFATATSPQLATVRVAFGSPLTYLATVVPPPGHCGLAGWRGARCLPERSQSPIVPHHGEANVLREIHDDLIMRAAGRGCPLCGGLEAAAANQDLRLGGSRSRGRGSRTTTHHGQGNIEVAWGGNGGGRRRCVVGDGVMRG
jgi:hypothetical protein